jgi:hypothetical protein
VDVEIWVAIFLATTHFVSSMSFAYGVLGFGKKGGENSKCWLLERNPIAVFLPKTTCLKFFCIQDGVGDEGGVIVMVGTMCVCVCVFELVLAVEKNASLFSNEEFRF